MGTSPDHDLPVRWPRSLDGQSSEGRLLYCLAKCVHVVHALDLFTTWGSGAALSLAKSLYERSVLQRRADQHLGTDPAISADAAVAAPPFGVTTVEANKRNAPRIESALLNT